MAASEVMIGGEYGRQGHTNRDERGGTYRGIPCSSIEGVGPSLETPSPHV